jgi:hypothetical protein
VFKKKKGVRGGVQTVGDGKLGCGRELRCGRARKKTLSPQGKRAVDYRWVSLLGGRGSLGTEGEENGEYRISNIQYPIMKSDDDTGFYWQTKNM